MKYLILCAILFISGCSTYNGITDAGRVYSMWQYQYQHRHLYSTKPEERLEGNYKAWGE